MNALMKSENSVEYIARAVRIGTLKTSASIKSGVSNDKEKDKQIKVTIDLKGIRFTVLPQGEDKHGGDITIKIPYRRLTKVLSHVGRSCPTLWIKTDENLAGRIRSVCNMKADGAYYDPESPEPAEQEISIISAVDPIPYVVAHSINKIFEKMGDKMGQDLYQELTSTQNNEKLVRVSKVMVSLNERKKKAKFVEVNKSPKIRLAKKPLDSDSDTDCEADELNSSRTLRSKKAKTKDTNEENKSLSQNKNINILESNEVFCKRIMTTLATLSPEKNARAKALIQNLLYKIEFS